MEMEFAQLAAVVAGADGDDAFAGGGPNGRGHGGGHGRFGDAVDHDFVGAVRLRRVAGTPTRPRNVGQNASEVDAFSPL